MTKNFDVKTFIDTQGKITDINQLKKTELLEIISRLPNSERQKLQAHLNEKNYSSPQSIFMTTRAYIYNHYIKGNNDPRSHHTNPEATFVNQLDKLLNNF